MIRDHKAFTTIELLVTISIIAILAGLLFVGARTIMGSSQERATRVTLANAQGMLSEYENKAGLDRINALYPAGVNVEAPGPVSFDAYSTAMPDRYSAGPDQAVATTQAVMQLLLSVPANRSMIEQMGTDNLLDPVPTGTNYPGSAAVTVDADNRVTPPVLVDGWNNPIIFVPADGLTGVILEAHPDEDHRVTSRGIVEPDNSGNPGPPPANVRPFFASAGPDGDFSTGDDNLYSFEE